MDKYNSSEILDNNFKKGNNGQMKEYHQKESNVVSNNLQNCYSVYEEIPNLLKTDLLHKEIVNQLSPGSFSHEDVLTLQNRNKELHKENIIKTIAYVNLEQNYFLLKEETAEIKQANEKRRRETNFLLQNALDEISAYQNSLKTQTCERNPNQELYDLKQKFDELQLKESQAHRHIRFYQDKYQYFENAINESKKQLGALLKNKNKMESENETWKNKCLELEYEKFALFQQYGELESEMDKTKECLDLLLKGSNNISK